jgi:hypothetical protein
MESTVAAINRNGDVMVLYRDRHFTDATSYNINQHSHECMKTVYLLLVRSRWNHCRCSTILPVLHRPRDSMFTNKHNAFSRSPGRIVWE